MVAASLRIPRLQVDLNPIASAMGQDSERFIAGQTSEEGNECELGGKTRQSIKDLTSNLERK